MPRTYSPSTVFRMADFSLLHTLFTSFGVEVELSDWQKMAGQKIDMLMKLKERLPAANKNRLESTLIKINSLSCSEGMQAISDAFDSVPPNEYEELVQNNASPYSRAMYIYLNEQDIFQRALTLMKIFQVSWSSRRIRLPKVKPSTTEETISLLESDIPDICSNYKDKGPVCSVECFEIDGIYYYYAWPDDYPEDMLLHNENKDLVHKVVRKTYTMAFSYDSVNGVCQLSTKGPKAMKEELQDMFLIDILGHLPNRSEIVPFELSLFLHPNFSLAPEPGEMMNIQVGNITLSHGGKSKITVHPLPNRSLWSELLRCSNKEYLSTETIRVEEVNLSFTFFGPDHRKIKSVSFALRPFQSTLKDETDSYSKKIINYLKYRRIANDEHIIPVKPLQLT